MRVAVKPSFKSPDRVGLGEPAPAQKKTLLVSFKRWRHAMQRKAWYPKEKPREEAKDKAV
jgi:hypothetical protein